MKKILDEDGVTEVEMFTADELAAARTSAATETEGKFKPQLDEMGAKLTAAEQRAANRSQEMSEFRKLSEAQVLKMTETERALYENQQILAAEREKNAGADKKAYDAAVSAVIRAKVGKSEDLFKKVHDMYQIVNLEDITPEQMAMRANAAFGAIATTEPDLLAAAGFGPGGSFEPNAQQKKSDTSFADTERGQAGADELGLLTKPPEKK